MKNLMAGEILQTQVGDVLKIIKKNLIVHKQFTTLYFLLLIFYFILICLHGAAV